MEKFTADEILKLENAKLLFDFAELLTAQIEFVIGRKIVQRDTDPIVELIEIKLKPQKQKKTLKSKKQKKSSKFYIRKLFEDEEKRSARKMMKNSTTDFHVPNIFIQRKLFRSKTLQN